MWRANLTCDPAHHLISHTISTSRGLENCDIKSTLVLEALRRLSHIAFPYNVFISQKEIDIVYGIPKYTFARVIGVKYRNAKNSSCAQRHL